MLYFTHLESADFAERAPALFGILADNMTKIAPTGNSREADYRSWFAAVSEGLTNPARKIVLIWQDGALIGFFQYYVSGKHFMMEECQITEAWQGRGGVFRALYGFVLPTLPDSITVVEAYAHKSNEKSRAVLSHLGLRIVGINKTGSSYRLQGTLADLLRWYRRS